VRIRATRVLASLLALIGVVLLVEAALVGGTAGLVIGALFLLAGLGRLYLVRG
jgi:hypothetical protein